jgi:hypothetical protein
MTSIFVSSLPPVSLKPLAPVLVRYMRGAMLGWMQQLGGDYEVYTSTRSVSNVVAGSLSVCTTTLLRLLQHSVHMSEDHSDYGAGQFEPVTIQLESSTPAGDLVMGTFRLQRAATDCQHLNEWLEAADYAATALITFVPLESLKSDHTCGLPGTRMCKGRIAWGGVGGK